MNTEKTFIQTQQEMGQKILGACWESPSEETINNLISQVVQNTEKRCIGILEDVLEAEYAKLNPPNQNNIVDDFRRDIRRAFLENITNTTKEE